MPPLQVIALCRFSYPTFQGTGFAKRDTSQLYSFERLARRLWVFEKICLPGIRHQTDRRFLGIILIGENLPIYIKSRLHHLTSDIPEIKICEEPEHQIHLDVCSNLIKKHRQSKFDYVAEMILDDDDCMGVNMIEELHAVFSRTHPLLEKEERIEIDFCKGFVVQIRDSYCSFKEVVSSHWTCGQAIVQSISSDLTIASFNHHRFWKNHICISSGKEPMFLRSFHGTNDTGDKWDKISELKPMIERVKIPEMIEKKFRIHLQVVAEEDRVLLKII